MIFIPHHETKLFTQFLEEEGAVDNVVNQKYNPYGPSISYRWQNVIVFGYGDTTVGYELFCNPKDAEKPLGEKWGHWLHHAYAYLREQMEKDQGN